MASATRNFDAVVIGAGFSGMHMLKSLRDKLGFEGCEVYEAGSVRSVGEAPAYGNRIPGAVRFEAGMVIAAAGRYSCCKNGNGRTPARNGPNAACILSMWPNATT